MDALLRSLGKTPIDILVNNAGIWGPTPLGSTRLEDLEAMLDINVKAVFYLTQAALPLLREGARIVNVSSIAGRTVQPAGEAYMERARPPSTRSRGIGPWSWRSGRFE